MPGELYLYVVVVVLLYYTKHEGKNRRQQQLSEDLRLKSCYHYLNTVINRSSAKGSQPAITMIPDWIASSYDTVEGTL